ncbi:MAG: acyltransferase [Methylophilaceae bacterium]|nr:acyltransferase [Methylophilaceae bacterium]
MLLNSLNYFRAISILSIVAGHCMQIAGIDLTKLSIFEKIIVNLISGGTTLFVFISGFLFHHIYFSKFDYLKFLKSKFKNVLIPFIFMTLPFIFPTIYNVNYLSIEQVGIIEKYVYPIMHTYLSLMQLSYWYIPFITIMFLLSPLHVIFAKTNKRTQITVLITLLFISAIIHRPIDKTYFLHSVIYFLPVYLIGIFCSIHKERIYQLLEDKEIFLLLIVIFISTLNAVNGHVGNFIKNFFALNGFDTFLFAKLFLCIFFMVFLHRFEKTQIKILEYIAAVSFSIYFLHEYLLNITRKYVNYMNQDSLNLLSLPPWINLIFIVISFALLITLFALFIKKLIPKYSKYLIGY